ncbi:hypothetical protein [Allomuricauda sp. R78024]
MSDTIYYILGLLAIIYIAILFKNKRGSRNRKSRKFMEGKRRHEK